jgi:DNA-binding transcriptional LysR family regulator
VNLKQIEVFLAVVDTGSFSAGARECLLTQSTVSQHMAALESELGVRLLERSRNGVVLTEAGRVLKRHSRQVVGDLRAAHEAIRRFRGVEATTLRLAASSIPGAYLIPPVLVGMGESCPELSVVLRQGDSRETVEAVVSREVDVGVVGNRFEERGLTYAPVGNDEIRLVVPKNHPWAARKSVAVAELSEVPMVVRESGSGTAKTVIEALGRAGVDTATLRLRAEVGSNEAVKAAVMAGLGASFLSEIAVRRDAERGDLALVNVEGLQISRRFFLVRRSGRDISSPASAFWDLMTATYG